MRKNKKGFTLAELLIVVAIIAVLVAIAVPIFSNQLESAREGTDAANVRSEYAMFMTDVLMSNTQSFSTPGAVSLKQLTSGWQNADIKTGLEALSKNDAADGETNVSIVDIESVTKGGTVSFKYSPATKDDVAFVTITFAGPAAA